MVERAGKMILFLEVSLLVEYQARFFRWFGTDQGTVNLAADHVVRCG